MNTSTRPRRVPDLRFRWMRRYDFSWVELVFCAAVLGGGVVTLLAPSRVSMVVELSGAAADHPTAALILTVSAVGVLVHHWSTIWGPVRVGRATARWVLSGPDDRTRPLARRLLAVGASMVVCCAASLRYWRPCSPHRSQSWCRPVRQRDCWHWVRRMRVS